MVFGVWSFRLRPPAARRQPLWLLVLLLGGLLSLYAGEAVSAGLAVDLKIESEAGGERVPVTSGLPIPRGQLTNLDGIRLLDPDGLAVPLQMRTLSNWPDGSARWLLLDFQARGPARAGAGWRLVHAPTMPAPAADVAIEVQTTDEAIRVDTGPLRFSVSRQRLTGLEDVWIGGRQVVPAGHEGGIIFDTGQGRRSLSTLQPVAVVIEEAGPLRTIVRSDGAYRSPDLALDFTVRIHAYAGESFVRLEQTFINPANRVVRLREMVIELPLAGTAEAYRVGGDGDEVIRGEVGAVVALRQSPDHRFGAFEDHAFHVYDGEQRIAGGARARGWISLSGEGFSVTAAVRDMWQMYPKGLRATPQLLAIDLWPRGDLPEPAGHMDINVGAGRTHEMLLAFDAPAPAAAGEERALSLVRQLNRPALAVASPQWYAASGAAAQGELSPAVIDGRTVHPAYERFVEWMIEERYLARRQQRDEYGMMHFGDYLLGGNLWNSLQYDLPRGLMQQFFRTGDRRWFDLAGEAVRAQRDLLVLWHMDPSRGARAHRSYGGNWRQGQPHGRAHGGEAMLFIGGMVDYHLLSGDQQTRRAILWIADGIVNVRDERVAWFNPHGHGWRAAGYPLTILADAHALTGDQKYRDAAVFILERVVFPNAHTQANGFDAAIADGVWWAATDTGWSNQAWMIDQMGDGLFGAYQMLEAGPVKDRTREAFLAVADWTLSHAWDSRRAAFVVRYTKDGEGNYDAGDARYGGFMAMLGVSTLGRAYRLTGERRYLIAGQQMFRTAVETGRSGVQEGKQVAQSMQYAPIFLHHALDTSAVRGRGVDDSSESPMDP